MDSWTSKHAILRDLSVAQGREVPVEIQNTVTENEKPPTLNYTEATEEEFFDNCVSNGDMSSGPDITLIQQMLDMVREINVTEVEEVNSNTVLEISKNDIHLGSGDGSQMPEIIKDCVDTKQKKKRKKNVAIASLLAAYGDNLENEASEIPKLLNSNFVSGNENNKQKIPMNRSLKPLRKQTLKGKDIKDVVSPTSMFKKRSLIQKNTECSLQQQNFSPISVKSDCLSPLNTLQPGNFVPSSHAGEYYKKYIERSELQATVKEDIWSRTEQQMREIDVKRIQESVTSSKIGQVCSDTTELLGTKIHSPSEESTIYKVDGTHKQK